MAIQYNLLHTAGTAPAINAQRIQVKKFAKTANLRFAAQRSFVLDGWSVWADMSVSGSEEQFVPMLWGKLQRKGGR